MTETTFTINAEVRNDTGTSAMTKARAEGKIPAVVYSHGKAINLFVNESSLPKGHTRTKAISLVVGSERKVCVMREVQTHPVKDNLLHIDFQEVSAAEVVKIRVPLEFVGLTREQDKEGFLKPLVRSLEVKGVYSSIPETLKVNVSNLKPDDAALVKDLELPAGISIVVGKSVALVTLVRK